MGLLAWLLRRWILLPTRRLSTQMANVAAGDLEHPLTPSGPTEIAEMGSNAERMRTRLLSGVDESARAEEAIAQQSPLVAYVRGELDHRVAPSARGWEVAGSVVPAEGALAGDWWDLLDRPDGATVLVVADIAGHGVEAGFGALRLRDLLRADLAEGVPIADALARASGLFQGEALATALLVELPASGGALTGSTPVIPRPGCAPRTGPRSSSHLPDRCSRPSAAAGLQPRRRCPAGGALVCTTDGATEARDAEGAELGPDGVRALAAQQTAGGAASAEVLERLQGAVRTHAGSRAPDDVTLVVVRRP